MSQNKNITAFTSTDEFYPSYVSINEHKNGVSIIVRSKGSAHKEGDTAEIVMSMDDFEELIKHASDITNKNIDPNQEELEF